MRLRVVSDLHFEFMRDGGASMAQEVTAEPYDVLVVAGDICSFKGLYRALRVITEAAGAKPVVYVLGNHEAYGGTWEAALGEARRAEASFPNLHVLERQTLELGGQRFVGLTLWFPHGPMPEEADHCLGDFSYIRDIYDFLPTRHGLQLGSSQRPSCLATSWSPTTCRTLGASTRSTEAPGSTASSSTT